jgi:hypothetical protein
VVQAMCVGGAGAGGESGDGGKRVGSEPIRRTMNERELRKAVDRAVSRALVDRLYAAELLSEPGCIGLPGVGAVDLEDLAEQAYQRLWAAPTFRVCEFAPTEALA